MQSCGELWDSRNITFFYLFFVFCSPGLYQDAMKALDACSCSMSEALPAWAGVTWVQSLPARRQTSLALPPALWRGGKGTAMCWSIGNNAGWGQSIGLMKQEHLSRVLALETCQKWDKCRSAISDLYCWLFPGSVHSPFPAVLGWR